MATSHPNLPGHLNWSVATYEGRLHWSDYSSRKYPGDDDYNWDLYPKNCSGLTTTNPDAIQLEFNSDETVDNINDGWWNLLHIKVDESDAAARQLIGESGDTLPDAIVIGLMGLDAEHGGGSELHPVYVMAIHLRDDPSNDTWAILARNWGDEGGCSHGEENIVGVNTLSLRIPRANASDVRILDGTSVYSTNNSPVSYALVPGGALFTFNLGPPQDKNLSAGLLQLGWIFPAGAHPSVAESSAGPVRSTAGVGSSKGPSTGVNAQTNTRANEKSEDNAEALVSLIVSNLPKTQRQQFNKLAMPQRLQVTKPVQLVQGASPQKRTEAPKVTIAPDPRREQRALMRLQILCEAYNGKIPGLPANACTGH